METSSNQIPVALDFYNLCPLMHSDQDDLSLEEFLETLKYLKMTPKVNVFSVVNVVTTEGERDA